MVPNLAKHHNVNIVDIRTNIPILNDIISVRRYYVTAYAEDCERPLFGLPLVLEMIQLSSSLLLFKISNKFFLSRRKTVLGTQECHFMQYA